MAWWVATAIALAALLGVFSLPKVSRARLSCLSERASASLCIGTVLMAAALLVFGRRADRPASV